MVCSCIACSLHNTAAVPQTICLLVLRISLLSIFVFVPGSKFEGGAVLNEVECWRTQRSFKSFFTHQFSGNVDVTLIQVPPFSGDCEVEVVADDSSAPSA